MRSEHRGQECMRKGRGGGGCKRSKGREGRGGEYSKSRGKMRREDGDEGGYQRGNLRERYKY